MPKRSEKRDTAKAEYIAKKKKGEEVSLRALAGELGVSYQTLRNWKAADKWEEALPKKKRGGQPGNQNSKGKRNAAGSHDGAPPGNKNAEKDGAYSTVFFDMISNNYIPEKINDANAYLDGTLMIGVAASVDLPEINMKTGTVEGFGIGGEVDSPTIGQWESFEQAVQFNTLYSSAVDMLSPMSVVNLTFRAAQQVYDKSGGYDFKGLRVVEMARVKKFKPGKIEKSEGMEAEVTVEVTYIMIEVDGEQLIEIDKLNGVYKVKGVDMLAKVRSLI